MVKVTVDRQSRSTLLLSMPRPLYLSHELGTMSYWFLLEMENWSHARRACTKRLDETKRSETRDETPRPFGPRPRRDPRRTGPRPRRERDVEHFVRDETKTLVCLETVLRPRRRDQDHIPGLLTPKHVYRYSFQIGKETIPDLGSLTADDKKAIQAKVIWH